MPQCPLRLYGQNHRIRARVSKFLGGRLAGPPRLSMFVVAVVALSGSAYAQNSPPSITSPPEFSVVEGVTAVATLMATDANDDQLIWALAAAPGADGARFSLSATGELAFVVAPDYEDPDDIDADRVHAVSVAVSDATETTTQDLSVTVTNLAPGLTGPTTASHPEGNLGIRIAAYEVEDGGDWSLAGSDSALFAITDGFLRFFDPPDYENPTDDGDDNVYDVIVRAGDGTTTETIDVAVTVANVDEPGMVTISPLRPKLGRPLVASVADPDTLDGTPAWQWERANGREGWEVIDGATAASYTSTAADTDRFLRATATYTDILGTGKTSRAMVPHVVLAHRLSSLEISGHDALRPMHPAFDPDTLHYAVGCGSGTLTLTMSTEEVGTRLAVNGIQRASQSSEVTLNGLNGEDERGDIQLTLYGSAGASTTYVVHCVASDAPVTTTTKRPGATEDLVLLSAGAYLLVIDNNGVPRFRRKVPEDARHFRTQPGGRYPYSYATNWGSVDTFRGRTLGSSQFVMLDKDFNYVKTVRNVAPVTHSTFHDFLVREDGSYALLSYNPVRRDLSAFENNEGTPYSTTEGTEDSIIQEVGADGMESFRWNSWDHMAIEDCTQHRFPWDYAHINTIEDLNGDYLASLRGCSQVLRIGGETGNVIWRLGRSNRSDADWIAGNGTPATPVLYDPYGEFCGQHSATLLPNGNLIMFDNGGHCVVDPATGVSQREGDVFSRVVEYALDTDSETGNLVSATFQRHHSLHGDFNRHARSQGHVEPMPNGHWLISWGRGACDEDPNTPLPPDEAITEVDPLTGEEVLSVIVERPDEDCVFPVRAYPLSPYALAEPEGPLTARIVSSPSAHNGPPASLQVVVAFNRPVVDVESATPSVTVHGGTMMTAAAYEVNGAPANAYVFTLTPDGMGDIHFQLNANRPCDTDAICAADGAELETVPGRVVILGPPPVTLVLSDESIAETGGVATVTATVSRGSATAFTVAVAAAAVSPATDADFTLSSNKTLSFAANETTSSGTVTITAVEDSKDEADEAITVSGTVSTTDVTAPTARTLTITDNDAAPSLVLSVSAARIDEDGGSATVTVSTGSGSTFATDETVQLAVAGTATETADYTISSKTLTLPAGVGTSASMVTATVTAVDDSLDDDDEAIEITGSRNSVALGSRQTIAIDDDDWPVLTVTFRQADYRVAEGGQVDLPITLSAVPERQVTIPIEIEGAGGAEAIDYSVSPTSLTFGASETDKTLRVRASNDSVVDTGESVALGFGTSLPERISEGGIADTTVAIRDTDFTFAPAFTAGTGTTESDTDTYTVSENSSALRLSLSLETPRGARVVDVVDPVVVTLATRENAGSKGTDEDYATQRRSGTFGDYGEFSRDLSFAPGDFSDDTTCSCARAERAVSVDIFNDRVHERVEVFRLRLSRKSVRLGVASKDITAKIAEDDAEPVLTLEANPGSMAEAGGSSTVTVSTGAGATFPAAQTIRLDLSGTAMQGTDYTIDATALTLPAGMGQEPSSVTATVRAKDDPIDDDSETVVLAASRAAVEFARRTIAIDDDETGSTRVDLSVNPAQVREDAGAPTVRVTASLNADARAQDTEVTVTVGASGDSAAEGTDYAVVSDLTLTIDAGETGAETTFSLVPTNNAAVDGARTITVGGSASGFAVRSADLTVNDDDVASTKVTLTLDPLEVSESAGSRAVRVTGTLDGGVRATATVVVVTVGSGADPALEGTDYADVPELELTIAANRTDGAVTFTLRPTNDQTAEGTETISVSGDVAGLTVTPTELALADNDSPSTRLDLSLNPSTVSEAAVPTDVVVTGSLNAGARTSDTVVTVTVGASTDSATEGLDYPNVSALQITVPANETTGRTTFTLSPENDAIAEGAETISVTGQVSGLTVEPATLTLSDNDTASRVVMLSVEPESVSEDTPENVTVTASLNAGARAEDTGVRLTVGAASDTAVPGTDYVRVSERTLTILAGETSGTAAFRLEPVNNESTDGTRTLSLIGSTTVAELRIEPATGAKVALRNDDNPAVRVSPERLTVVEAASEVYRVALQTRPTADVTVTIGGVSGDLSLDKTSLVFTQADWRDPQQVEVMAADDDDSRQDPDVTLTHRASGAAEYRGLRSDLVVSIRENDPSLVFSGSALTVREGQTATYTVALATVPTADVTVQVTGVSGDLSLDKTRLVFRPGDWDDAQTITVEAAEDDDTSTDPAVTLTHQASGGGYDGISGTVRVTITENDGGGTSGGGSGGGGGGGGGGGSANRPPVVTEPIGAQVLELEGSVRIDATEHFRDPERRTMTFAAESGDLTVATVEVDGSVLTLRGVGHGVTAVTVTATDDRRLQATQTFAVSVGTQVSFANEAVSAVEGATTTLTLGINRPRDTATTLDYVIGVDTDALTDDADAHDHDGTDGTVTLDAQAAQATIRIAIHDDADIEPPRETFTVTLQATDTQLLDFGLGAATVHVTIEEGVCDRTRQVRNALRRSLPCESVAATDLAAVRELDLSDTEIDAVQSKDLSGLSGLQTLGLSDNDLTVLPEGLFAGLGMLGEVQLQDNPGAPFMLHLDLARTDGDLWAPAPARIAVHVREGAPFALHAPLLASNGTVSPDAARVSTGMTGSMPLAVTQDAEGATRVRSGAVPEVPATECDGLLFDYPCFQGLAVSVGGPLTLFKDPPAASPDTELDPQLGTEGDATRIDLSRVFMASDGGPLTYAASSSDAALATVSVSEDGVLTVTSNEDGEEGTVAITVTATDADGLSVTLTFEVTIEPMPRGLLRGWRRGLLEQMAEEAAVERAAGVE